MMLGGVLYTIVIKQVPITILLTPYAYCRPMLEPESPANYIIHEFNMLFL